MNKKDQLAPTEEQGSVPVTSAQVGAAPKEPPRRFLQVARRNLTEEEAASPAALRWLQYEAERLEQDCGTLRDQCSTLSRDYNSLRDKYEDQRVESEKLRGQVTITHQNEYLSYLCLSAGSAGMGAAPGYIEVPGARSLAVVGGIISAVLVIGGIALRKRKLVLSSEACRTLAIA